MTIKTIDAFEGELLQEDAITQLLELGRDQGYVVLMMYCKLFLRISDVLNI